MTGAFNYGSWAARYAQHSGPVPNDIDLLVIGEPDRHLLGDALEKPESVLHAGKSMSVASPPTMR